MVAVDPLVDKSIRVVLYGEASANGKVLCKNVNYGIFNSQLQWDFGSLSRVWWILKKKRISAKWVLTREKRLASQMDLFKNLYIFKCPLTFKQEIHSFMACYLHWLDFLCISDHFHCFPGTLLMVWQQCVLVYCTCDFYCTFYKPTAHWLLALSEILSAYFMRMEAL